MRYEGSNQSYSVGNKFLDVDADTNAYQAGVNIFKASSNGADQWVLGAMAGYGTGSNGSNSEISKKFSNGKLHGYSAGLYGTWFQRGHSNSGFYVDSWLLYNHFNNTVKGEQQNQVAYKSSGFTGSVEGGYNYKMGEALLENGKTREVTLRPQAQLIWSGVKADRVFDQTGAAINSLGKGNVQARIGGRVNLITSNVDNVGKFTSYAEVNWIVNTKKYGVQMNDAAVYIQGSKSVGEVKFGFEGQLNKDVSIWAGIAFQKGSQGYSSTRGHIGMQYSF